MAEGATNLTNALRQRFIADRHVGPDGRDQFLLRNHPAGMLDQIAQDFEVLAPEVRLTGGTMQA